MRNKNERQEKTKIMDFKKEVTGRDALELANAKPTKGQKSGAGAGKENRKKIKLSKITERSKENRKSSESKDEEKKKLYLGFNKKERAVIDQAFRIVKVREQEKRAGREFRKEVVREQVKKTKDIFFMGITKGLIQNEQAKMKREVEKGRKVLSDFEKKIHEDNNAFKKMFDKKKQLTDHLEKEANLISNQKNKVIEELKKKSEHNQRSS